MASNDNSTWFTLPRLDADGRLVNKEEREETIALLKESIESFYLECLADDRYGEEFVLFISSDPED